jgi:hypothetical protein
MRLGPCASQAVIRPQRHQLDIEQQVGDLERKLLKLKLPQ